MVKRKNKSDQFKLKDIYRMIMSELKKIPGCNYQQESRLIICYALKCNDIFVYTHNEYPVKDNEMKIINNALKKRKDGMPVQYITNRAFFMGLEFKVDESVLIPRPDTEILVRKAIAIIEKNNFTDVLDIGTGSGCISVSIAKKVKHIKIDAVDIKEKCLLLARENAKFHNVEDNICFRRGNLFKGLNKKYDMIVSNPPYISQGEFEGLQKEVKDYEPKSALIAGDNGYQYYTGICKDAGRFLKEGGYLLFETGYNQAQTVWDIMKNYGFKDINVYNDLNNIRRVVIGRSYT